MARMADSLEAFTNGITNMLKFTHGPDTDNWRTLHGAFGELCDGAKVRADSYYQNAWQNIADKPDEAANAYLKTMKASMLQFAGDSQTVKNYIAKEKYTDALDIVCRKETYKEIYGRKIMGLIETLKSDLDTSAESVLKKNWLSDISTIFKASAVLIGVGAFAMLFLNSRTSEDKKLA